MGTRTFGRARSRRWGAVAALVAIAAASMIAVAATPAAAVVPDAPTNVQAVVGHYGWAEISWTAPASDGGSPIEGYMIRENESDPGTYYAGTYTGAQYPVDYGVTYTFAVAAVNADGQGPWSASAAPVTPTPVISIGNASTVEGTGGTHVVNFTVSLDDFSAAPVTMAWKTVNATAKAPGDFVAANGTLTFSPGETSKTIPVTVNGDSLYEKTEKMKVTLSTPTGGVFKRKTGVMTITDDDTMPTLSIADHAQNEGRSGTTTLHKLTVTLSAPSGVKTKFSWATVVGGTATAGSDYYAVSGTKSIAAGKTSVVLTVKVIGDNTIEPDETVFVDIASPLYATIADGHAVETILNDD